MLMRTDPFQELDRLTRQMFGTVARLDAYRKGEEFYVHFDLPGVDAGSIELEVERNMLAEEGGHDDATGETAGAGGSLRPAGAAGPGKLR